MFFKSFKMKKQGLNCFFKVINKKKYTIKKGIRRLSGLACSTLYSWIGEFLVSFFDVINRLYIVRSTVHAYTANVYTFTVD